MKNKLRRTQAGSGRNKLHQTTCKLFGGAQAQYHFHWFIEMGWSLSTWLRESCRLVEAGGKQQQEQPSPDHVPSLADLCREVFCNSPISCSFWTAVAVRRSFSFYTCFSPPWRESGAGAQAEIHHLWTCLSSEVWPIKTRGQWPLRLGS